ncbi:MAG: hypothetical protein AAGD07_12790 [Planctomycetota bacterium]
MIMHATQRTLCLSVWLGLVALSSVGWVAGIADGQTPPVRNPPAAAAPIGRDPTIPSLEIQRRTRTRPDTTVRTNVPRLTTALRTAARSTDSGTIVLQSLIQSSDDACTATLRFGDQSVTISFVRGQTQQEVQLPATQFADFASTVQRLSGELRQLRAQARLEGERRQFEAVEAAAGSTGDPSGTLEPSKEQAVAEAMRQATEQAEAEMLEVERQFMRQAMQPQRIDLASSFTLGGNLYRVIDFARDTLLLEQVPLGKYVIVR